MKSLIDHYPEMETRLRQEIKKANTSEEIVQIIQKEIRIIAHHDSDYILSLTDSQRTLAWERLESLSKSFNMLTAIKVSPIDGEENYQRHGQKRHSGKNHQDMNNIAIGAVSGAVAGTVAGIPIVGTAVGIAVGAGVGLASNLMPKDDKTEKTESTVENKVPLLRINLDVILSNLYQGFQEIDQAVTRCLEERRKQPDKPSLDKLTDVLEVLQDLMGEELDEQNKIPTLVSKQLKRIPSVLRHYGMEARVYEPKGEPSSRDYELFEFEPSLEPDLQEYVTMKPAFIKGDEVILQGRVIEPQT
ncbi:glycine zipper family protein [Sphaerospermopsis aphanizomenoides BCCUSP55]|uniref:glycine zipper family protein n=1 Tax=Sphaerospermopsis aphanizomenoides TaxID=459663 RepID=UPI0019048A7D|nr:glycine zipper family protein [Sphaerospermopsis aphanizomenoides]MBK1986784.1 glycine zipper family protein [Sphaerospermopsis aphanizomenoides BCCUSP55]